MAEQPTDTAGPTWDIVLYDISWLSPESDKTQKLYGLGEPMVLLLLPQQALATLLMGTLQNNDMVCKVIGCLERVSYMG